MKFNCKICKEEVETNDAVFTLDINVSTLRQDSDDELGDLIHSPIYTIKICSLCADHINLILHRGAEIIKGEKDDGN